MEPDLIAPFLIDLSRLQRRLSWSREQLVAYRAKALTELRAFAVERSPFYGEFHRGLAGAPLSALPILTRSTLLHRFDDLVTDRRIHLADARRHLETAPEGSSFLGRYRLTTSTGSSGGQVSVIVASPSEWAFNLASTARTRDLAGQRWRPWRRDRTAMIVSATRWLASARTADSLRSRFAPQILLDANAPIAVLVAELNAYQPHVLSGYGSAIGMLAEEQEAGRLAIAPRLVITGGEVTLPEVRRRIAAAWGDEPFDYYGSAEGGTIAAECREGRRMHLFEDTTIIEVVDGEGRQVPRGTWGAKVLVTPLWLRTEPLIRFELTDVLRVSPDPCPCGRPTRTLDGLHGRAPNFYTLPAANGHGTVRISWMGLAPDLVKLPATYRSADMEGGTFVIELAGLPPDYDLEPLREAVRAEFAAHGALPPPVVIRLLSEVPRAASGKAAVPGTAADPAIQA